MAKVAFIGLGRMGAGMARRVLDCGHELRVFNRTAARADDLASRGAVRYPTPRDACDGADAVLCMVANDEASRAVWRGASGALAAMLAPGALAIECSTLSHDWVLELSADATGRGLRYLDAPVTGLPDTAAAGELTLLVGADPAHLRAAQPLMAAFARNVIHFGQVGTGTAYKLLVNMLGAVQIASAAEVMAIAEKVGLDLGMVADALATGQAASPQVVRNTRRMAQGNHDDEIVFTQQLRLKDVDYALALARKFSIGSPFGRLAGEMFRELSGREDRQTNESKVIDVARGQPPVGSIQSVVKSNLEAWNASAAHHKKSAGWRTLLGAVKERDFSCLDATVTKLLLRIGVAGRDVIQLGCNNGRECLSVAALGARKVVGVDQSAEFLAQARELSEASFHQPQFVEADIYALPPALHAEFDLALVTIGVLNWMPDLRQFFSCAASTMRNGGTLLIYETHPFLEMFSPESADPFRPAESYFRTEPFVDDRAIVYEGAAPVNGSRSYWFVHRLSDIFTAALDAGLQITHFKEYAHRNREETYAVYEGRRAQLPMCYTLAATKLG
jgi:3-hydroxyisobutyrate dehydrogenase-like beta-hydroxyacid dehydrogenase/SAM-dependent methyltransferase